MIKISTDNSLIYALLEECGQLPIDFSIDKIQVFDHNDNFYLVIYSAIDRDFILFEAQNYLQQSDELPVLLNTLQDYSNSSFPDHLIEKAMKLVENKLHSKNNSRFFFDAH